MQARGQAGRLTKRQEKGIKESLKFWPILVKLGWFENSKSKQTEHCPVTSLVWQGVRSFVGVLGALSFLSRSTWSGLKF